MKVRFLIDENLSPDIVSAMLRHDMTIDVLHVGDLGAPGLGTLDPEVLLYCESEQRMLITDNRKSMPGHIADHLRGGRHHWGVVKTRRKNLSNGEIAADLILIWEASEAEEYQDREDWIPL